MPDIYSLYAKSPGDFNDIVSGNNDPNGGNNYDAGPGYDMTTGLGTPVANLLVPDLAKIGDIAPVVTTTATTITYGIGVPAIAIDPGVTVADTDSANLAGATVSISSGLINTEDVLGFTNQNGITGTYSNSTGVLTLAGSASVADYQSALASVTYVDTNALASAGTRKITFTANDGLLTGSNTAARSRWKLRIPSSAPARSPRQKSASVTSS